MMNSTSKRRDWSRKIRRDGFRRIIFEMLEERRVLAGASYDTVDSRWFERLPQVTVEPSPAPSPAPIAHGHADDIARWVVRLNESELATFGTVAKADQLVRQIAPFAHVVQGLGLPGQVLVVAPASAAPWVESQLTQSPKLAYASRDTVFTAQSSVPNDPRFGEQYALENVGGDEGVVDADIDATDAWEITRGRHDIVVAVLDSGIDVDHADLTANLWTNNGEIPGNNVDDDHNGYVDDIHGYNFRGRNGNVNDENGHGTHVAGIIGAVADNGIGGAGIAPEVSLMAVKFLDANNDGFESEAAEAINYVSLMRQRGVDVRVINASWVSKSGDEPALREAIRAAGEQGILFVSSAGNGNALRRANDNDIDPVFPSSYNLPNMLSVAASDRTDQLAPFFNYGAQSVQLAAPGLSILSTELNDSYGARSGTSMAAPFVAGVAALYWSQTGYATVAEVREAILAGADLLPDQADQAKVSSHGRLNAYQTLVTDTVAPHAELLNGREAVTSLNEEKLIVVKYTDNTGIDQQSVDTLDISVRREGSDESVLISAVQVDVDPNTHTLTATYHVTPPGGNWDSSDNGKYYISLSADEVSDSSNRENPVAAISELGRFNVDVLDPDQFRVSTTADSVDISPGDGKCEDASGACSVRAAIIESNAFTGPNTIFVPAGEYFFDHTTANEDLSYSGDLDILGDTTVAGAGSGIPMQVSVPQGNVVEFTSEAPLEVNVGQSNLVFSKTNASSYQLILPEIHIPLIIPSFLHDGEWFELNTPEGASYAFEFDNDGNVVDGRTRIAYATNDDTFSFAANVVGAINQSVGTTASSVEPNEIVVVGNYGVTTGLETFSISSRTPGAIADGQYITIGVSDHPVVFEFDSDGEVEQGRIAIPFGDQAKTESIDQSLRRTISLHAARISNVTVIDARSKDRIFDIHADAQVQIRDLAMVHGLVADGDGGGIRHLGADLVLTRTRVANNAIGNDDFELKFARIAEVSDQNEARASDVAFDKLGNLYSIGYYKGNLDLDASGEGPALPFAESYQLYAAKFSVSGKLEWAYPFLGSSSTDLRSRIEVDKDGNIVMSSAAGGAIDFDLTDGANFQMVANGFVAKYEPDGHLVWAASIDISPSDMAINGTDIIVSGTGQTTDNDVLILDSNNAGAQLSRITAASGATDLLARGIAVDSQSAIYVTGSFSGTIDVDPSENSHLVTSLNGRDTYLVKLSAAHEFEWAKTFSSPGDDWAKAVEVSDDGDVYLQTNSQRGDLTTDDGIFPVEGGDAIVKLTSDGSVTWLKEIVGASNAWNGEVDIDGARNVVIMGAFGDSLTVDLDPGPRQVIYTTSSYGFRVYVAKWNEDGDYILGYALGNQFTLPGGLAIDSENSIAISGESAGPVDFDPSPFRSLLANVNDSSLAAFVTSVQLPDGAIVDSPDIRGGGLFASGNLELIDSQITDNQAMSRKNTLGGGLFSSGTLRIQSSTVANNLANQGGGVAATGNASIESSTIESNQSMVSGGGIQMLGNAQVHVIDSTVAHNTSGNGGGLASQNSKWTLERTTVFANSADVRGGGIDSDSDHDIQLIDTTISANTATRGGGIGFTHSTGSISSSTVYANKGIYSPQSDLANESVIELANTILSSSSGFFPPSDVEVAGNSLLLSTGHNLIGTAPTNVDWRESDLFGVDRRPLDPLLGPLQNNGGVVPTHSPTFLSPAIDQGSDAFGGTLAANGVTRPFDGDGDGTPESDIGAVEAYFGELHGRITRDTGSGLAGWIAYLDENQNEVRDADERFTHTDIDGFYSFGLVPPGDHVVREEVRPGWQPVAPVSTFSFATQGTIPTEAVDPHFIDFDGDLDADIFYVAPVPKVTQFASELPVDLPEVGISTSKLEVPANGKISDLNVLLNLAHTFVADLVIDLVSPLGTLVTLVEHVGGKGQNFENLELDDEAPDSVSSQPAPVQGRFRPSQSLASFDGELAKGTWTLFVHDFAAGDGGQLLNWALEITRDSRELKLITNNNGVFSSTETIGLSGELTAVAAAGDINADSIPDILVGQVELECDAQGSCFDVSSLTVFEGTVGNGWTIGTRSIVHLPEIDGIRVADLNNDGVLDVIVSSNGEPAIGLLQEPNGFETSPLDLGPLLPGFFPFADFNQDGSLDLVDTSEGRLAIRYGLGDAFLPGIVMDQSAIHQAIIRDFDGDAFPDLFALTTSRLNDDESAQSTVLSSPTIPLSFGENEAVISASDLGAITRLRIGVNLTHVADTAVLAELVSPNNTRLRLFAHAFLPNESQTIRLLFGDDFTNAITDDTSFLDSEIHSFRPDDSLSASLGASVEGTWMLRLITFPINQLQMPTASVSLEFSSTPSFATFYRNDGNGLLVPDTSVSSDATNNLLLVESNHAQPDIISWNARSQTASKFTINQDSLSVALADLRRPFLDLAASRDEGNLIGIAGGNIVELFAANFDYRVSVRSGEVLTELDFANHPVQGQVRGIVFHDINGDGRQSGGELGLPDFRVYIDPNNNGQLDDGEPSAISDDFGAYVLSEIDPVTSLLRVEPESGWVGTLPTPASVLFDTDFTNSEFFPDASAFQFSDPDGGWQLHPSTAPDGSLDYYLLFGRETTDGIGQIESRAGRVSSPIIDLTDVRGAVQLEFDQLLDLDPSSLVSMGVLTRSGLFPLPDVAQTSIATTHTVVDLSRFVGGPIQLVFDVRPSLSTQGIVARTKELTVDLSSDESYFIAVTNSDGQPISDYRLGLKPELPDLTVTSVLITSQTSESLTLAAEVRNIGTSVARTPNAPGEIAEPVVINAYFSRDAKFDSDDLLTTTVTILTEPLETQASLQTILTTNLNVDLNVFPYLLISADGSRVLRETSESNNVYALRVGTIGHSRDDFEPNDNLIEATALGEISRYSASGLTIHSQSDVDYFAFQPDESGVFHISLVPSAGDGDLDMALLDSHFVEIGRSTNGGNATESIGTNLSAGENYYLRVFAFSGTGNYRLFFDATEVPADINEPNDELSTATDLGQANRIIRSGLSIDSPNDRDLFGLTIDRKSNYTIEVTSPPTEGTVEILVLDESGQVVQTSSTSNGPPKLIVSAPGPQRIVVEVRSLNGDTNANYQLAISRSLGPDAFEPNDTSDTATDLTAYLLSSRSLTLDSEVDRDVFQFTPTQAGRHIITADFLSQSPDLNLFVYDSRGDLIATTLHRGWRIDNFLIHSEGAIPVEIAPGADVSGVLIGIQSVDGVEGVGRRGSLSGNVYRDSNSDRVQNQSESGEANRKVFLDNNRNGMLDAGEPFTFSDDAGNYAFQNLAPGTYTVALESLARSVQTSPVDNHFDLIGAISTGDKPQSVVLHDFDADGQLDIASANSGTGSVSIRLSDDSGQFTRGQDLVTGAGATWVTQGDWDGDGDSDLAVANMFARTVTLLRNDGGLFALDKSINVPPGPTSVLIAQLDDDNGDQRVDDSDFADLVVTTLGTNPLAAINSGGEISVFLATAPGVWGTPLEFAGGVDPYASITSQLNDDNGDQVVDSRDLPDVAVIAFGDGQTTGTVTVLWGTSNASFIHSSFTTTGRGGYSITAADLTDDRRPELVVVNAISQSVTVLRNVGSTEFVADAAYGVGKQVTSAIAADMDGDGDLDIALSSGGLDGVAVLRNEGIGEDSTLDLRLGAVSAAGDFTDSFSFGVASGDFNDDNVLDLVVAKGNTDRVVVLKNDIVPSSRDVAVVNREVKGVNFGSLVLNGAPTLGLVTPSLTVPEDSIDHVITLSGISDGDDGFDDLVRINLQTDHPEWFSELRVDGPNADGTAILHFRPNGAFIGVAPLQITVEDAGVDGVFSGGKGESRDNLVSPTRTITIQIEATRDYGNAPSVFGQAAHRVGGPRLGAEVDVELPPSDMAHGDSDDDGVTISATLVASIATPQSAHVTLSATHLGSPAFVNGWIDWNADGDWTDPAEQILSAVSVVEGDNAFNFEVPVGSVLGTTFARFRISSQSDLGPVGNASDGEVEDYELTIVDAPPNINSSVSNVAFVEKSGAVAIADDWAIHEDSGTLVSGIVKFESGFVAGQDQILFDNANSIQIEFDEDQHSLHLEGLATLSDYEAVIHSLRYMNISSNPSPQVRVIAITLDDGRATHSRQVTVNVTPTNDAPTIEPIANVRTSEGHATEPILAGVSDPETPFAQLIATATLVSAQPISLLNVENISVARTETGYSLIVSPADHQSGTATIRFSVSDTDGAATDRTFVVVVDAVNDSITIDEVANQEIDEEVTSIVNITGISAGPGESQPLSVSVSTDRPTLFEKLSVAYTTPDSTARLTAEPATNQSGLAEIFITVTDGGLDNDLGTQNDNATQTTSFTLTVRPVNDPPIPTPDQYESVQGNLLVVSPDQGVLVNDINVDLGDHLVVIPGTISTQRGAKVVLNRNGSFVFSPRDTNETSLGIGEASDDLFEYVVTDDQGNQSTGTAHIRILGKNDPPDAAPDNYDADEDTVLNVAIDRGVLQNDTDPDANDHLSVSHFDTVSAKGAAVSVSEDGTIQYDPNTLQAAATIQSLAKGQSLVDSFTYSVSDGHGDFIRTTTVFITVHGANDWSNPAPGLVLDVNKNNTIEALDALLIINTLNNPAPEGARRLPGVVGEPKYFFDTNEDGFVSAIDVLLIIDKLNAVGEGEGISSVSNTVREAVFATPLCLSERVSPSVRRGAASPWIGSVDRARGADDEVSPIVRPPSNLAALELDDTLEILANDHSIVKRNGRRIR